MKILTEIIPSYRTNLVKVPNDFGKYQEIVDNLIMEYNPNEDKEESYTIEYKMTRYILNAALDQLISLRKDNDKCVYLDRNIFNYFIDRDIENNQMYTASHKVFNVCYCYLDDAIKVSRDGVFDINDFHKKVDIESYKEFLMQELTDVD